MSCFLEEINHEGAKEQFAKEELLCPLFKRVNGSLVAVCAHCCYRIQQLTDTKRDLIWRQRMVYSEYQRDPSVIKEYLPDNLKGYYDALEKHGKTIEDADHECRMCKAGINQPIINRGTTKVAR